MNFWRKGEGLEWILFMTRSLELRAHSYALNLPPRAAASFNHALQRIGASRFALRHIKSQWRLAPIADLCVRRHSAHRNETSNLQLIVFGFGDRNDDGLPFDSTHGG